MWGIDKGKTLLLHVKYISHTGCVIVEITNGKRDKSTKIQVHKVVNVSVCEFCGIYKETVCEIYGPELPRHFELLQESLC